MKQICTRSVQPVSVSKSRSNLVFYSNFVTYLTFLIFTAKMSTVYPVFLLLQINCVLCVMECSHIILLLSLFIYLFSNGSTAPWGPRPPHFARLHDHTF
jgi:hypothetical protein